MIYILAEGHGENEALPKLAQKICINIGFTDVYFSNAKRKTGIHKEVTLLTEIKKIQYEKNVEGLLIVRDEEDYCPREFAPKMAALIRNNPVNFPIAYHLMYREFETLFYAYLNEFKGKRIKRDAGGEIVFRNDVSAPANPEHKRDAKGMLSDAIIGRTGYKPSTDQLALTKALDIDVLRNLQVPCFGTLERCIQHLVTNKGRFAVYPR